MSEKALTRRVRAYLDGLPDVWCFKVHGGGFQLPGVPDIVGVRRGRFFAIELKDKAGRVTRLQQLVMDRIAAAGGAACVARTLEEVVSFIEDLTSTAQQ